ncbi:MAG: sigma 54-interacting transcriptional regulator [Myxococcota bacterium]
MVDRTTLVQTGLVTGGAASRTPQRIWVGRVLDGSDADKAVRIGATPVVVGADGACDLVLRDPTVSRRHAELSLTPQGVRVVDLGSKNGTFYSGSRVSDAIVPAAAPVRFGDTTVRFDGEAPVRVTASERRHFGALTGESQAMREVFAVLELAAPSDVTVLIEGESGTGKELAARALHDHSERAAGPFIIVDCSATSEQLLDSQLFGHRRGAFTGATHDRSGAFVEAGGGTLFIDEIGELPLAAQGKLLRALEARTVQPLGSDRQEPVNVRVVAATHRNLSDLVAKGEFRFDLFYRLAVVHLVMPSLRSRPEDIPELVRGFLRERSRSPGQIAGPNLQRLREHAWPGNARELRNVIERAWVLSGGGDTGFADLRLHLAAYGSSSAGAPAPSIDLDVPLKEAREGWLEVFERRYLEAAMAAADGNLSKAAERVGMGRRHLRALLQKYGLRE